MKKFKKGFTLLEILVVIAIIMILVTMGTTSFATAQRKARDAKRKADVRVIGQAMEQYYSVCGNAYPIIANGAAVPAVICTGPSIAIMPTVPLDPGSTPYKCNTGCTGSGYQICSFTMEAESPTGYCINNQQ
ncbi:type II secretion system protein [Candidatus Gottesmanbacteria bacterium]|nr:type II secretion system protein [Candidatus Gottesmanbacteria bacterium]